MGQCNNEIKKYGIQQILVKPQHGRYIEFMTSMLKVLTDSKFSN